MNQILELRDKRAKAWDAAKAFLDTHRDANGTVSAEDAATYDKMEAEVVHLGHEIDRLERQAAIDREMMMPVGTPLTSRPETPNSDSEKSSRASDSYRRAFWNAMRSKRIDPNVYNALQIGTASEGGYLVPDEYMHLLLDKLQDLHTIRGLATIVHTDSGERKIPVVASHGTAAWTDEEAPFHESDEAFTQITLGAHKLTSLIKVSDELLNDSVFDIPGYMANEFARRIGDAEETAFFTGNGSHKPIGLLNATDGAETGVTAASASVITMDEVIDLYHSLREPYRKNAVFIMNDATLKVLRKLKVGTSEYLWQPSVVGGTPDKLLNCPVYTSTDMPTIAAAAKTILFGDLSYYWIAEREGFVFQRLNELYATTGQVGFLCSERIDARLVLPEAVKVLAMKAT